MRKTLVVLLVVVLLLVAGAVAADRLLHARTERELTDAVTRETGGTATVEVLGFPFLTQVAGGRLDHVQVHAEAWSDGRLRLEDIDADGFAVTTTEPYTAERVRASALVPLGTIQHVVDDLGVPVALTAGTDGDRVTLTAPLLGGVEVGLAAEVRTAGPAIELDVVEATLGGVAVSFEDLGLGQELRTVTVPLEGLPAGLTVDRVEVREQDVRVEVSGRDVVLELPAG